MVGYMQDCGVSSALAIPQSCTRLSAYAKASSINEKLNIVNIIGMCLQGHHWLQINIDLDIGLRCTGDKPMSEQMLT